jgi:RNA polymerase sigma-70 factor (ECF subfamily)
MSDSPEPADPDLVARIAAGDRAAFAVLFGRYAGRVKAFLMRGGTTSHDADEMAQEVMVSVWRKAASFDPAKAAVSTWIYAIARNRRIDTFRRHARPEPDPEDPHWVPDAEPDGMATLAGEQLRQRMATALGALPPEQVQVLQLAFYDGLSHGEIADSLRLPLGTVKSRIRLGFRALRAGLGEAAMGDFLDD